MSKKPLISYVLTAYNIEEYIAESVRCAFAQTYEPLEIVLSDDCSSDRTFDIMQQMANSYSGPHKIVLNRNPENIGITKHMNKAYIELAHGEIIIAAHGDDLSIPERTQLSYEFLAENKEYTAVSGSLLVVDSQGNRIDHLSKNTRVDSVRSYELNTSSIPNIPAPSRAFYKRVMTTFGPLQDFCPTEDELISFRSLLLGKNAFLPDIFVSYRKHKGSASNPEHFSKFPLEKISEQKFIDLEYAVKQGFIDSDLAMSIITIEKRGVEIRTLYRSYFSKRNLSSLLKLVSNKKISFRNKLHYIKEHILYLVHR